MRHTSYQIKGESLLFLLFDTGMKVEVTERLKIGNTEEMLCPIIVREYGIYSEPMFFNVQKEYKECSIWKSRPRSTLKLHAIYCMRPCRCITLSLASPLIILRKLKLFHAGLSPLFW